jgi:hypothetical protein
MSASTEYRVSWQRDGRSRRTRIWQTRDAAECHALVIQGRMVEATGKDPEAFRCCDGNECDCGGATNAQVWARQSEGVPPLTIGPVIDARTVGEWTTVADASQLELAPDADDSQGDQLGFEEAA